MLHKHKEKDQKAEAVAEKNRKTYVVSSSTKRRSKE